MHLVFEEVALDEAEEDAGLAGAHVAEEDKLSVYVAVADSRH